MVTDKELNKTVEMAIPCETCPVKNAAAMVRRVWLKKKILEYLSQYEPAANNDNNRMERHTQ